jgi:uncharacterized protein YutE (UPF0331/DUF86 family)
VTDPLLVLRKLMILRDHLARIVRRRTPDVETFLADVDLQDALSMSLLVCLQESADIALHLASDEGWGVPGSYADGFDILAKHGVIDKSLAADMTRIATLRNRIAHGYSSVDARRLWTEVPAGVATIGKFEQAVAVWMAGRQE